MKKFIVICAFVASFFLTLPVQADSTYSVINSSFHVEAYLWVPIQNYPQPAPLTYYSDYSNIDSPFPVGTRLSYGVDSASASADFHEVSAMDGASTLAYDWTTNMIVGTVAVGFASTEVLFKPNFIGEGTPITFVLARWDYAYWPVASIVDVTEGAELFHSSYSSNYPPSIQSFAYPGWNPDHTYKLYMSARAEGFAKDRGVAQVNNNMLFVPEPSTMLLLGINLVGLWGVRRKLKK